MEKIRALEFPPIHVYFKKYVSVLSCLYELYLCHLGIISVNISLYLLYEIPSCHPDGRNVYKTREFCSHDNC